MESKDKDVKLTNAKRSGNNSRKRKHNGRKKDVNSNCKNEGYMTSLEKPNVITNSDKDNDPKWYTNLDAISKDYASLPMSQVLGLQSNNRFRHGGSIYTKSTVSVTPGIMTIYFEPTIGMNQEGPTAPINVAAQQLYTLIRRANSGRVNYDKTDVIMLIIAMDSAYMLYEDMLRAYRVLSTYSNVNRYYPDTILQALGYDPKLQYQLSEFRGVLDMFAYKLASVNIPDQLDLVKRHSWMCSNMYLDDDSNKAQSYAFVPQRLYRWVEGSTAEPNPSPTHLIPVSFHPIDADKNWTLSELTQFIDSIMNPILGSEDVGTITGDMMKAFGEAGMIKIRPVEDYAALVPVYSEEVLMQIRNGFSAVAPSSSSPAATGIIEQVLTDTTAGPYLRQKLSCQPGSDGGRRIYTAPLLNFINEEATPENVLVATRLITLCDVTTSGGVSYLRYYGTENFVGSKIWTINPQVPGSPIKYTIDQDVDGAQSSTYNLVFSNFERIRQSSNFKNAPAIYLYVDEPPVEGVKQITYNGPITNMCNYIYLDDETVKNLHEVATMSLFTVKDYKLSF